MRVKLQLVLCSDDGQEATVTDVVTLKKDHRRIEPLGLTLTEAKQFLNTIQQRMLQHQIDTFLAACSMCKNYGAHHKAKGYHNRSFRTLFGTFKLASLRLFHCGCKRRKTTTFRPLTTLLPTSVAPDLLFMETKWASLVSYGPRRCAHRLPAARCDTRRQDRTPRCPTYITHNGHLIPKECDQNPWGVTHIGII